MFQRKVNKNAQDSNGKTPLHYAAERYETYLAKFLIDSNVDTQIQDNAGQTPLHRACELGNEKVCGLLIDKKTINARTKNQETPLMLACKSGNIKIVQALLAENVLIKELRDKVLEGTALHWACFYDHLAVCRLLVDHDFDPNERANSLSLAHLAITNKNHELLSFIVEKQIDLNAQDNEGNTPLHLACKNGFIEGVEYLLIKKALKNIELNKKNVAEKTALHLAVEHKRDEIVELLLRYGVTVQEKDIFNKTPLWYAAEKQYDTICALLIRKMPTLELNGIKASLVPLIRGNKELEKLFGSYYGELAAYYQVSSPSSLSHLYDTVPHEALLDKDHGVKAKDTNSIFSYSQSYDQVSEPEDNPN